MSGANVACPTPGICKATSHHASSAAALACRVRRHANAAAPAAPPAPPAPTSKAHSDAHGQMLAAIRARENDALAHLPQRRGEGSMKDFAAAMRQALAASDPAGWTTVCGAPHPAGGYTTRTVDVAVGATEVEHRDADGKLHNAAGPAYLVIDRAGQIQTADWRIHGQRHRADGPARMITPWEERRSSLRFCLNGVLLYGPARFSADVEEAALARYTELLAAGCAPTEATCWLGVGHHTGDHDLAEELRTAGADPALCLQAAQAGVADAAVLADVGHGRLPISWAAAGLG